MSHERLLELCPIHALGALDGEELRELEKHLESGCEICQRQIREYTEMLAVLPEGLPNVPVPPALKGRLMDQIGKESARSRVVDFKTAVSTEGGERPVKTFAWLPWACAAAAGIALVVSLWDLSNLNRELSEQRSQLSQQGQQMQELQNQLDQEKAVTTFLSDPEVRVTLLAGTDKSPQSAGKILWNPKEKRALFYASRLPVPPVGKTYQLWVIAGNKPIDAGTFSVNEAGNGFLKIDSLASPEKAQKFAVTLEPAGGVPQPTGEMRLLGSV
jgi:anti-sigma-K factor RskA